MVLKCSNPWFDKLKERINEFMESIKGAKIAYQLFNKDQKSALILAIVTPLIQRVHSKVIGKLIFHKKLNKIQSSKYLPTCAKTQKNFYLEIHFSYSYTFRILIVCIH